MGTHMDNRQADLSSRPPFCLFRFSFQHRCYIIICIWISIEVDEFISIQCTFPASGEM